MAFLLLKYALGKSYCAGSFTTQDLKGRSDLRHFFFWKCYCILNKFHLSLSQWVALAVYVDHALCNWLSLWIHDNVTSAVSLQFCRTNIYVSARMLPILPCWDTKFLAISLRYNTKQLKNVHLHLYLICFYLKVLDVCKDLTLQ